MAASILNNLDKTLDNHNFKSAASNQTRLDSSTSPSLNLLNQLTFNSKP